MSKFNSSLHVLLIILVCAVYTFVFSAIRLEKSVEYMEFKELVRGWADTPFQYRFLVPWLAGVSFPYLKNYHLVSNLVGVKNLFEHLFVFALLCSFAYCAPYLISGNHKESGGSASIRWAAAGLLMLTLPFHFTIPATVYYYPSDIPAILFFTLGLILLRLRKWFLYILVFMLATFNRETILFLSLVFLLTNWKSMPRLRWVGLFILQIAVWIAIKFLLYQAFRENAADSLWYADGFGIFRNSWERNMQILMAPGTYVSLSTVYGYLWIPLLIVWKNIRDQWLKSALLVVPFFHLAMLIPGEINELRIYAEMLPLVILGVIAGIVNNRNFIKPHEYPSQE